MITPNKVVSLDDSVLSKLAIVLRAGPDIIDVVSLFHRVSDKFDSIDQFLLTLDTLYVLGRIKVDYRTRELTYAL